MNIHEVLHCIEYSALRRRNGGALLITQDLQKEVNTGRYRNYHFLPTAYQEFLRTDAARNPVFATSFLSTESTELTFTHSRTHAENMRFIVGIPRNLCSSSPTPAFVLFPSWRSLPRRSRYIEGLCLKFCSDFWRQS